MLLFYGHFSCKIREFSSIYTRNDCSRQKGLFLSKEKKRKLNFFLRKEREKKQQKNMKMEVMN